MPDVWYLVGVSFSLIMTLIGVLYKMMRNDVQANEREIRRVEDETDERLDAVEKDIVQIKTKMEK